jgi:hypothetical protein
MADDAHPPRQAEPPANAVLAPDSLVRDTATGERISPDRWLMNAIARGDLVVEAPRAGG